MRARWSHLSGHPLLGKEIPIGQLIGELTSFDDSNTYIHRVGTTAPAGKSGKAVSLVAPYDTEIGLRTEKALGRKIEVFYIGYEECAWKEEGEGVNHAQSEGAMSDDA